MRSSFNSKIVKNTGLLYFRMILIMLVSLYTVRVVLNTLGIEDYGINNVVGGIVSMLGFLSSSMSSASQRFFAFELGKGNIQRLRKIFNSTLLIYVGLSLIVLILSETIGLWFLNNEINVPFERRVAANWVYQFSVFSFILTMITVPFNALIIANERMNVYAVVSVLEVVLKLGIVYLLVVLPYDKLIIYALLSFVVSVLITLLYMVYCYRNFKESKICLSFDKMDLKNILAYSGWNLFGALANVFNNQGLNILLNIFFGPIVNTSKAIASRINSTVSQFVLNFMTASRPQIIKSYSVGNRGEMLNLVFQTSKYSFVLLFIATLPFLFETRYLLVLWLEDVPDSAIVFVRLALICSLIDSLSYPLMTAAQATGKIKVYQIVVGGIMLLGLPISYLFLKLGFEAYVVFIVSIVISFITLFVRLVFLNRMIDLNVFGFIKDIIFPILLVIAFSLPLPFFLNVIMELGFVKMLTVTSLSFFNSVISVYFFALNKEDRVFVLKFLKKNINFKKNVNG